MTPEQLTTLNTDAPSRGDKLIILMMIANFGSAMAYSGFNGALMDASQREPEATRATLIGDVIVIHYVFMVVSSFVTGIGLNGEDYGGTFSWTMGFNAVMWVCAPASFLTTPFSWYCIQERFWLGVPLVGEVPFAAADYVDQLLILEIGNQKGFEATLLGLGVTTESVGTPFATVITKSVDGYFDIERTFIEQDTHYVRSQVTYTYLIAYAFNLLSIAAVFWLPKQKDEVHEMQQRNRKSKFWGIVTMSYLIFSLAWTLMTNILSLFDSTSCLRIAGGSGC
ncbi:Acetylornithine aminotransferase [Phytophthora cinnamomi]|uniref:Acetylornithine aminotransferase n=1 Tax=Phytophthora cinnamomi TaxID=4785 RepID=UPI0035597C60|nr:Acetylornithine aminotransferase [Phytophthora cinnamomi]